MRTINHYLKSGRTGKKRENSRIKYINSFKHTYIHSSHSIHIPTVSPHTWSVPGKGTKHGMGKHFSSKLNSLRQLPLQCVAALWVQSLRVTRFTGDVSALCFPQLKNTRAIRSPVGVLGSSLHSRATSMFSA